MGADEAGVVAVEGAAFALGRFGLDSPNTRVSGRILTLAEYEPLGDMHNFKSAGARCSGSITRYSRLQIVVVAVPMLLPQSTSTYCTIGDHIWLFHLMVRSRAQELDYDSLGDKGHTGSTFNRFHSLKLLSLYPVAAVSL